MPLALFVGGGALLFTAFGIYRFLTGRHISRRSDLTAASPMAARGNGLPAGTLLDEGRFLILGPDTASTDDALHTVKATVPLKLCSSCYAAVERERVDVCPVCGKLLTDQSLSHPLLVAREISAERFAVASELASRQLMHRAVVMPVAAFIETSLGLARYFQIEPRVPQNGSASMPPPSLDMLLAWGSSLAYGLEHLHRHDVTLERVGSDHILSVADEAHWLGFSGLAALPQDGQEKRLAFYPDIQGLAQWLLEEAVEACGVTTTRRLPTSVREVFERGLAQNGYADAGEFATALTKLRRELAQQAPVRYSIGFGTDVGCVRKLNEDSLWVMDGCDALAASGISVSGFAVADGVGGHTAGDVASRLTVEALAEAGDTLSSLAEKQGPFDAEDWITAAALAANHAVYTERKAASSDMGCTLVLGLLVGRVATILNVGDSRAYKLGVGGIRQLTTDHSLVQRLVEIGQLTRGEARHHPQKSVIYRVMGDGADLAYDLHKVVLQPGEAVLLCSDGLSDMVEDDILLQVWRAVSSPQTACERLVTLAKEAGGYDNITVVIAQVDRQRDG